MLVTDGSGTIAISDLTSTTSVLVAARKLESRRGGGQLARISKLARGDAAASSGRSGLPPPIGGSPGALGGSPVLASSALVSSGVWMASFASIAHADALGAGDQAPRMTSTTAATGPSGGLRLLASAAGVPPDESRRCFAASAADVSSPVATAAPLPGERPPPRGTELTPKRASTVMTKNDPQGTDCRSTPCLPTSCDYAARPEDRAARARTIAPRTEANRGPVATGPKKAVFSGSDPRGAAITVSKANGGEGECSEHGRFALDPGTGPHPGDGATASRGGIALARSSGQLPKRPL
ncbi:MAG: hypothetical protein U0610_28845 [bacterium]